MEIAGGNCFVGSALWGLLVCWDFLFTEGRKYRTGENVMVLGGETDFAQEEGEE
jgi:hypothetical protein